MAKAKASQPKKSAPAKKPSKSPSATPKSTTTRDVSRVSESSVQSLIQRVGARPTDAQRGAWLAQYPLALTQRWASQTASAKTELECWHWASGAASIVMDASLAPNLGYPKARLVFLLECLQDLSSARLKSAAADDSVLARVAERGAAVTAAQTELSNLKRVLRSVAGRNPEWRAAISSALELASPRTDVVEQLGVLLQLARVWQTGETQLSLLCSQFELAAVVEAASAARERAKQSRSEAAGTGANASDKDSSAINLLEARMLGEMAALYDALSNAREATQDKRYKIPLANATARIFSSGQDTEKPKPPSPPAP